MLKLQLKWLARTEGAFFQMKKALNHIPSAVPARPLLVFGCHRSGTTPVYVILNEYLQIKNKAHGLGEFFNLTHNNWQDSGKGIERKIFPPDFRGWPLTRIQRKTIKRKRFELLKKYPNKYFLKFVPFQINCQQESWLARSYDWVFVERKNIFENLLSFQISYLTDQWYVAGGISVKSKSLVPTQKSLNAFLRCYKKYCSLKEKIKPTRIFFYEDLFLPDFQTKLIKTAIMDDVIPMPNVSLPERQSPPNKLSCFAEPEVLYSFYRKSFLNKIKAI